MKSGLLHYMYKYFLEDKNGLLSVGVFSDIVIDGNMLAWRWQITTLPLWFSTKVRKYLQIPHVFTIHARIIEHLVF